MSYVNHQKGEQSAAIRYVAELMRYRHLGWNLVQSDLRSRFRRSSLGIIWAMIQPLGYALVIAWVWGTIFQSQGYWTFAAYVYAGMLIWEYFNTTIMISLEGLVAAGGYLRQSRIPFLVFQMRVPLTGMVIFYTGLTGLILLLLVIGEFPALGPHLLLIPLFALVLLLFLSPLAILFSILGTQFRDLRYILAIALQALFFLSPVFMERKFMGEGKLEIMQVLNPLVPLLDMLRDPVLYGHAWSLEDVVTVFCWSAGLWLVALIAARMAGRNVVFTL